MSISKLRKCGDLMEKDGVIVKRPGKKFVCPKMPEKMKIPTELASGMAREDIDQMNALKEQAWRREKTEEYNTLKRLYYFQECVKFISLTARTIIRVLSHNKKNLVRPDIYANHMATHHR